MTSLYLTGAILCYITAAILFVVALSSPSKARQMTREILNNPEEMADLERSREQSERGEVRWLDDDDELAGERETL